MYIKTNKDIDFLIDDSDICLLDNRSWQINNCGYIENVRRINGKFVKTALHRLIMGVSDKKGVDVDHIDRNRLNNSRSNLRICTRRQNMYNKEKRADSLCKYKGITRLTQHKTPKWQARINLPDKRIHLGCFKTEEDAARAYDNMARKVFGEFALCNFTN